MRKLLCVGALLALVLMLITVAACQDDPVDEFASEDLWVNTIHELDGPDIHIDEDITIDGTTTLDGDLYTDRWLNSDTNFMLGVDVAGNNALAHTGGNEGWHNLLIGNEAGYSLTTGAYNIAIGEDALRSATTQGSLVGIGYKTLWENTTGYSNLAIGTSALYNNIDGASNTAIGSGTLFSNVTGDYNTAIGTNVLANNTGNDNFGAGVGALSTNTSGGQNFAAGRNALNKNSTGNGNVGVGYFADYKNTSGNYNIGIGSVALFSNETGLSNTAVGYGTGYSTTGSLNVFLGYKAGYNEAGSNTLYIENTNANENNALIYGEFDNDLLRINGNLDLNGDAYTDQYLNSDTNTFLGVGAAGAGNLSHIGGTDGWYNVLLGNFAGEQMTTGYYNFALGYSALENTTSGDMNIAIGASALRANTTKDANVAVGSNVMRDNNGQYNIGIGYAAIREATGVDNSVAIGYSALYNDISGDGNIAIGYQAGWNETGSNKLYIENSTSTSPLIGGDFSSNYVDINGDLVVKDSYIELDEMTAPGAGAADTARIYAVVDGGGLTDLCAVFQDGTIDTFAQETTPLDAPIFTEDSGTALTYKMIKPHPGLIQFVVEFPTGETFVMREIEYHDADKIAANTGTISTKLPVGWEVTTETERVNDRVEVIDAEITALQIAIQGATIRKQEAATELASMDSYTAMYSESEQVADDLASLKTQYETLQSELESIFALRADAQDRLIEVLDIPEKEKEANEIQEEIDELTEQADMVIEQMVIVKQDYQIVESRATELAELLTISEELTDTVNNLNTHILVLQDQVTELEVDKTDELSSIAQPIVR